MADWGAFFRADDGTLLVTSDTPCYEYVGEVAPTRSGNVSTYTVTTTDYPLVFLNVGGGGSAGVLAIEGSAGAWTVTALTSTSCNLQVFTTIKTASTSGYGLAVYDTTGRALYDSAKKSLSPRGVALLSEGVTTNLAAPSGMVSYTCGPVKPSSSASQEWVTIEQYFYVDQQYLCGYTTQWVCTPSQVYTCGYQFSCGFDYATGGYVCGNEYVCGYTPGETCGFQQVYGCGFQLVQTWAWLSALVKTTTWAIERGVARLNSEGTQVSFDWLTHKSGYYKQILQYDSGSFSMATSGGLPVGYVPIPAFLQTNEAWAGELTKNNTFPYTTARANEVALSCITTLRSDYD